jgi:short-subunit dehydrogenase
VVEDLSREVLRAQFETSAQGEGRIIQMSSLLGIVSLAYRGAYNASKYALEALSDTPAPGTAQ